MTGSDRMVVFECECCDLMRCTRKSPGIGYYCDDCLDVCLGEHMDACNPYDSGPSSWPRLSNELHARLRGES